MTNNTVFKEKLVKKEELNPKKNNQRIHEKKYYKTNPYKP